MMSCSSYARATMALVHELVGFSSYPYAKSPTGDYETRAKDFSWAYKNGRGGNNWAPTFADVIHNIVRDLPTCPAFTTPSILVPIPRSGSSRDSFERDACTWPNRALAKALAGGPGGPDGHVMAELVDRAKAIRRSSDGPTRVPVKEHVASLRVQVVQNLLTSRIVLLDDVLVKGAQALACFIVLRRAGYIGPIEMYAVHQSIAPNPTDDQREPFLCHRITWNEDQPLPHRIEVGAWRPSNRARVTAAGGKGRPGAF